jgi:diguanylate cyclase
VTTVTIIRTPIEAPLRPPPICRFVDASADAAICEHCLLDQDLRGAISRGELRVVYQPLKDIRTNQVIGFEALLRWQNATRGEVLPAEFIPIAEDTGTIFGEWVLRTACREAATWAKPLTVAVNISAVQIHNVNVTHAVHEILFENGLTPKAGTRNYRNGTYSRSGQRLATLRRIKTPGGAHCNGRLRDRLFVALQSARVSIRQDQDRRFLHKAGEWQR